MKTSWKYAAPGMGFILFTCLMLGSCSTRAIHPEPARQASNIKSILILPFQDLSRLYESNIHVRCYLCGQVMATGFVPDSAGPFMTSQIVSLMEKNEGYTILSSDGSQDLLSGMMSGPDNAAAAYLNLYIGIGKRAGADAVLIGHIFRFRGRAPSRCSAGRPMPRASPRPLTLPPLRASRWSGRSKTRLAAAATRRLVRTSRAACSIFSTRKPTSARCPLLRRISPPQPRRPPAS